MESLLDVPAPAKLQLHPLRMLAGKVSGREGATRLGAFLATCAVSIRQEHPLAPTQKAYLLVEELSRSCVARKWRQCSCNQAAALRILLQLIPKHPKIMEASPTVAPQPGIEWNGIEAGTRDTEKLGMTASENCEPYF
jgi:hypothetical protein